MMTQQESATHGRTILAVSMVFFAGLSLYFAFSLFVQGIGGQEASLVISIVGLELAPGTVGTAFLAIAAFGIYYANKVKPVIQSTSN